MNLDKLQLFHDERHRAFLWTGGPGAALLVHGFPGTPAEVRPMGRLLREAGWTVRGLLLPGFGAEIDRLSEQRAQDWIGATAGALEHLRRRHSPVVLVGYSMGGAVAINAARAHRPDGLVLIAPFWRLVAGWQALVWPLLRLVIRRFRPFRRADFGDPDLRRGIGDLLPDVDLDDPDVQEALRSLALPTRILEQLRLVGQMAYAAAPHLDLPGLIVQGSADTVSRPEHTRRLVERMNGHTRFRLIPADHNLMRERDPALPQVARHTLDFLQEVRALSPARHQSGGPR